jgi:hypothetical protein
VARERRIGDANPMNGAKEWRRLLEFAYATVGSRAARTPGKGRPLSNPVIRRKVRLPVQISAGPDRFRAGLRKAQTSPVRSDASKVHALVRILVAQPDSFLTFRGIFSFRVVRILVGQPAIEPLISQEFACFQEGDFPVYFRGLPSQAF